MDNDLNRRVAEAMGYGSRHPDSGYFSYTCPRHQMAMLKELWLNGELTLKSKEYGEIKIFTASFYTPGSLIQEYEHTPEDALAAVYLAMKEGNGEG